MDVDLELPVYTVIPPGRPSQAAGGSSSTTAGSQHTLSLEDSSGFKWLTLSVNNRAPDSTSLPIFYEGDTIAGQVDFNVLKPESVKGISIKIAAGTTLVGQEQETFFTTEHDLWTPSIPLPNGESVSSKFAKGNYSWPFALTLPAEVKVQDQKVMKTFPLPPSFSERASTGYLDYKIIVTVKRGMFRVNQILFTNFSYIPMTRPEPPSQMRQKAYKENLHLVGPEGDPDGWHVLPPLTIQGKIFDSRTVEVTLSLALAQPLAYSRGTAMPLWLTLTGNDDQALDLLSSPKAIRVLLVRSLATGANATDDDTEHRTDNCFLENVARAVFWAPDDACGTGQRVLHGEVDIKWSLKSSALFPKFTIRYHLELLPFEAAGFVATAPKSTPLLRQKVTIANFPTHGVTVRSQAPPEYVQEQAADYNKSVGLLENGNQRFFHHIR